MKIASIQMDVSDRSKKDNIQRADNLLSQAIGADLILLPELWNIGFFSFDKYKLESETDNGDSVRMVAEKAIALSAYILAGSIIEKANNKLYNTSYFIDPNGRIIGKYRKIHLFGFQSYERKLLAPGKHVAAIETDIGNIGLSTCYDLRFPELYRKLLDLGVELFLVTSAWPKARLDHWLLFNRIRALENQSYLISSNAVGISRDNLLGGHSQVVDPFGNVVAIANDSEGILRAEIDLKEVKRSRSEFPATLDRAIK
ncbi:MAG: carbon-nitrogen family hydrolase [Patescibacteria group bacterium]